MRPETSPPVPFPGCPHPSDLAFIESGAHPPSTLSKEDIKALKDLYQDLSRIAERGEQRGVKIIVDAEYSWYQVCYYAAYGSFFDLRAQPAIDAFTWSLMRRFNALPRRFDITTRRDIQPLVYSTFQAYLKRCVTQAYRVSRVSIDGP